ncbi:MAG: APC family permease [Segniliparus sp.]|uniref:APC family permease n=1 Tax=Segniliparus sp. TaxID=2804064 RepID=UPI003F3202B9
MDVRAAFDGVGLDRYALRIATTDLSLAPPTGDKAPKGLKLGALGLFSSIVVGLSATGPAYSLAGAYGSLVGSVGEKAPGILLIAFLPSLLVAFAYRELCQDTPDCGTTFTWATKAFGPWVGWLSGWGLAVSGILCVGNAAEVAAQYSFRLAGIEPSAWARTAVAAAMIIVMTWVSYRGVVLSRMVQNVLTSIQFSVLVLLSLLALAKVLLHRAGPQAVEPKLSWLVPTGLSSSQIAAGVILCVFIYWGWDSCLAVAEETEDATRTPGRAAVITTLLLLATYVLASFAAQSSAGTGAPVSDKDRALDVLGTPVAGSLGGAALWLTFCVSALASTQTTILPTARQTLSMAVYEALPARFARVHPRYLTPGFGTVLMGATALAFYLVLSIVSENVLADSVESLGLAVAFYYAMTAYACVWYFRKTFAQSWRNLFFRCVLPLLGALSMTWAFFKSCADMLAPDYGATRFGPVGGVFVIGIGMLALGVPFMLLATITGKNFFAGRTLNARTEASIPPPPDSL